jgi:flavin reductase (DIM6/NTAB) family NADH-FMN oxidoreductase RutF
MEKRIWKPGTLIYPLPAIMVSCGDFNGEKNIITIAWTGTICSNPPLCYISVRPERHSYQMIKESGEFVINLTTESLAFATDFCGVKSGENMDKFKETNLTPLPGIAVKAPIIGESPLNIECKVIEIKKLGSHDMFIAEVVAVHANEALFNPETDAFDLNAAQMLVYSHGHYFGVGKKIGRFGYSVMKEKTKKRIEKVEVRIKK